MESTIFWANLAFMAQIAHVGVDCREEIGNGPRHTQCCPTINERLRVCAAWASKRPALTRRSSIMACEVHQAAAGSQGKSFCSRSCSPAGSYPKGQRVRVGMALL